MSRIKLLLNNTVYFFNANLIPRFFSIFLLPIITRILTPADFGLIALFTGCYSLISQVNNLGFTAYAGRMIVKLHGDKKQKQLSETIGMTFVVTLAISFILSVILSLFPELVKKIFFPGIDLPNNIIIWLAIWTPFFSQMTGFINNYQYYQQKGKQYFWLMLSKTLLMQLLIVITIIILRKSVLYYIGSTFFSELIIGIVSFVLIIRVIKINPRRWRLLKKAFLYSYPYVLLGVSGWLLAQIDRIFLAKYTIIDNVGIYSFAFTIANLYLLLWKPVKLALLPEFSKRMDNPKLFGENNDKNMVYIFWLYFIIGISICLSIAMFSREIVMIFAGEKFYSSYIYVPMILIMLWLGDLTSFYDTKIQLKNRSFFLFISTGSAALLNMILNFYMIPIWQIYGAVYASMLSTAAIFGWKYIYGRKIFPISYQEWKVIPLLLLAILIYIVSFSLSFSLLGVIMLKIGLLAGYGVFVIIYLYKLGILAKAKAIFHS